MICSCYIYLRFKLYLQVDGQELCIRMYTITKGPFSSLINAVVISIVSVLTHCLSNQQNQQITTVFYCIPLHHIIAIACVTMARYKDVVIAIGRGKLSVMMQLSTNASMIIHARLRRQKKQQSYTPSQNMLRLVLVRKPLNCYKCVS